MIVARDPGRYNLVPSMVRRLFEYLPGKRNCSLSGREHISRAGLEGKERLHGLASPHCWPSSSARDSRLARLPIFSLYSCCLELAWDVAGRTSCQQLRSVKAGSLSGLSCLPHVCSLSWPQPPVSSDKWKILVARLQHVRCCFGCEAKSSDKKVGP